MALEKDLIPVNTMGVKDEETGKWIPLDAAALRSHTDRLTIEEIRSIFKDVYNEIKKITNDVDDAVTSLERVMIESFKSIEDKFNHLPDLGLDVTTLGADRTGTKDSTTAIQTAFSKGKNSKQVVKIIIPPGFYRLEKPLIIYGNIHIIATGATMLNFGRGYMVTNGDGSVNYRGYKGNGNFCIDGGTWNYRGDQVKVRGNCFSFGHAENITVKNCTFRDVASYHAIEFNAIKNFRVHMCNFEGFIDLDGTRYFSEAIQIDLMHSYDVFGAFGEYDYTACQNGLVTGCNFGASGTPGTQAWPRGVGSHAGAIGKKHLNINVSYNQFNGIQGWAVRAYGWDNTVVQGNSINDCKYGIQITSIDPENVKYTVDPTTGKLTYKSQDVFGSVIANNNIKNTTDHFAIYLKGYFDKDGFIRNTVISGNVIDGVSGENKSAIRLDAAVSCSITGNQISNATGDGVLMFNCVGITISGGNGINSVKRDGIAAFDDCSDLVISGNQIRRPGRYGIEQSGVVFGNISGNSITGAGNSIHGEFESIRIANSSRDIIVHGNKCRSISTLTNLARAGLYITDTCKGIVRYGNDCRGNWTVSGIVDNAPDTKTDAKDVV